MGLIEVLRERKKSNKSILVFPTLPHPNRPDCGKGDNPDGHLLELSREIAFRAGLNCGHCKGEYTVYALSKGAAQKVKRTTGADLPRERKEVGGRAAQRRCGRRHQ